MGELKNSKSKLQEELYQSRAENSQILLKDNQSKRELDKLKDELSQQIFKFNAEKMNKNESEYECIKRGFLANYNGLKKVNLFKKDIIQKIQELVAENSKNRKNPGKNNQNNQTQEPYQNQNQIPDIESFKILAQTKLELSRLRSQQKDSLQSITLLEK